MKESDCLEGLEIDKHLGFTTGGQLSCELLGDCQMSRGCVL